VNLGAFDLLVQTLTIGKGNSALSNNTALGYQALFHVTTGNFNTAGGYQSLHNITTGQYNTALGQSSMYTATSAAQNVAIGLNALLYTTSGGSNVVMGVDGLQHNTTGASNVALGYNAGSHITGGSTPNTTSGTSIYIGRDTKALADGQSNQIVIGYNAVGNGSNTATIGNSSITANYFTGSVNAGSFVKSGGTSSQFLKADGSVDSSSYVTSNIYTANGTLTSARTLTLGGFTLDFIGSSFTNRFTSAGRLLLGTTSESTFLLDVNGTAKVSGLFTIGLGISGPSNTYFDGPSQTGNLFIRYTSVDLPSITLTQGDSSCLRVKANSTFTTGVGLEFAYVGVQNLGYIYGYDRNTGSGKALSLNGIGNSNVIVGGIIDVASAQLQISSTTKGFLPPRMTTTQKNAIGTPAAGLMVFDTTLVKLCVYSGTAWETITSL
jgi:hypothetical protein